MSVIPSPVHEPVFRGEVVDLLHPRPDGFYVDATVGMGGHAAAILEASAPTGRLLALDRDPDAIELARERLRPYGDRVRFAHTNFDALDEVLAEIGLSGVDGIVMDLGMSSYQLDASGRGFSFQRDEPLDMRMNPETGLTAADVVNRWRVADLEACFRDYGEERWARRIANAIATRRRERRITTSRELADLIASVVPSRGARRIHPATRVFQALRILVNDELGSLDRGLTAALQALNPGGVLCVIAFHSLEDRIVKRRFREVSQRTDGTKEGRFVLLTKRPLTPSDDEVRRNRRARSAKLRAIRRADGEE